MKIIFTCVFMIICHQAISQNNSGVFTLDGKAFGGNDAGFKYGVTISGGGILHEQGKKVNKGILLGLGAGLHIHEKGGTAYFPVFLEVGYLDKTKKVFPYISIRGGYGFNDSKNLKGGLYSEFRGGVSLKVGVCRFSPYAGLTIAQFRAKVNGETLASTHEGIFVAGIAFVFAR